MRAVSAGVKGQWKLCLQHVHRSASLRFKYTRPKPNIALWDPLRTWLFFFHIKFRYSKGVVDLVPAVCLHSPVYECHQTTRKEQNSKAHKGYQSSKKLCRVCLFIYDQLLLLFWISFLIHSISSFSMGKKTRCITDTVILQKGCGICLLSIVYFGQNADLLGWQIFRSVDPLSFRYINQNTDGKTCRWESLAAAA